VPIKINDISGGKCSVEPTGICFGQVQCFYLGVGGGKAPLYVLYNIIPYFVKGQIIY
jgi:hypothetical protein